MALARQAVLDATIKAAGVPIDGLSVGAGPPDTVVIQYRPEATAEQIAAAEAIVDAFDYRPRRDLTPAQIAAGVAGLSAAQEVALRRRILARVLLANPADAQDLIASLNLPLAVDEVVPS